MCQHKYFAFLSVYGDFLFVYWNTARDKLSFKNVLDQKLTCVISCMLGDGFTLGIFSVKLVPLSHQKLQPW